MYLLKIVFTLFVFYSTSYALSDKILADMYLLKAKKSIENKNYQEAVNDFEKILKLKVSVPNEFYYHYAKALMRNHEANKAYKIFSRYIEKAGSGAKNYKNSLNYMIDLEDAIKKEKNKIKKKREREKAAIKKRKEREKAEIEKAKSWLKYLPADSAFIAKYPKILDLIVTKDRGYLLVTSYSMDLSFSPDYFKIFLLGKTGKIIKEKKFDKKSGNDFFPMSIVNAENGYIASGRNANSSKIEIAKLDKNLNILWQKQIADFSKNQKLIKLSAKNFLLLVGDTIYKVDKNAKIIWKKRFKGFGIKDAKKIRDGNYILAGTKDDNLYIAKVKKSGQTIWEKKYGYKCNRSFLKSNLGGDNFHSGGNSIIELANGDLIVAGYASVPGNIYNGMLILNTDKNGKYQWDIMSGPKSLIEGKIAINCEDGGFVIASQDKTKIWVLKFDKNIKVILNKVYEGDTIGTRLGGLAETIDNGLIISGNITDKSAKIVAFVKKLDRNGK